MNRILAKLLGWTERQRISATRFELETRLQDLEEYQQDIAQAIFDMRKKIKELDAEEKASIGFKEESRA